MGIPYTTPDAVPDNSPMGNMASQLMKAGGSGPSSTGGATQTTATGMKHTANPNNPNATRVAPSQTPAARPATTAPTSGFNYDSVMKQPGMQAYAKPAPAKPVANYGGGQAGYGQVASTFGGYNQPKASAVKSTTATPIATPTNKISAPPPKGAPTPAEKAQLDKKIQQAMQAQPVTEVSPEYIERYKKEHGRRATAADQAGDYAKGHEHFKKINKLTKQQFQRGTKPEKVDEISNFMTLAPKPVSPEEQWKRQIRLLAKQYQTNASSLAALARENGPDSAEAVAYEYLRNPSKIRVPGTAAPASAVNWDDVIRRLPMGLSGMALLQAAEEYLINNKGMLRSTVRSLLNNDENQRTLSAAYAKKKTPAESVTEESDNEAVEQAIVRRIMVGRTDLLLKYGPKKVMQAVEDVADYVGSVDEIGSSDVSGWVRQVEQVLGQ